MAKESIAEKRPPNQIPWLGEGVTSLLTHGGCQADPPSVEKSKAEGRKAGSDPLN